MMNTLSCANQQAFDSLEQIYLYDIPESNLDCTDKIIQCECCGISNEESDLVTVNTEHFCKACVEELLTLGEIKSEEID